MQIQVKQNDEVTISESGGSSVIIEPLAVTQNGTYTAETGSAYSPVEVAVPNPNSVETIEGTFENPFGQYTFSDLYNGALNNQLSLTLTFTLFGSSYTLPAAVFTSAGSIAFSFCGRTNLTTMALSCGTYVDGELTFSILRIMLVDDPYTVTVMDEYLTPSTPATLTIIHHPLPESN